jgi:hypothetical protein
MALLTDSTAFSTTLYAEHDSKGQPCCGCVEVLINKQTGRCLMLCNECGAEMGAGTERTTKDDPDGFWKQQERVPESTRVFWNGGAYVTSESHNGPVIL